MSEFEETLDNQSVGSERVITELAKGFLITATKWANFLSILGYIGLGFMFLGAIGMVLGGTFRYRGGFYPFSPLIFTLIYIGMLVLYFFPIYYLGQFASRMKSGLNTNNTEGITKGFEYLKSHYKFLGISAIVVIGLYIMMFIGSFILVGVYR